MKILMCVPNISEGTNLETVEQVVDKIRQTDGVKLLDYSSDADHNRSVLTYLGSPAAVLQASKAMALKALELIDMAQHQGSHPRMGAIDVVPFVPVRGIETEEAVEISRQFGQFLGAQGVPVYYYEDSATRPERENLAKVRKGQYEALPEKLQDPAWLPDEGPATFNAKSGATAVSARYPLVAFNVNLRTTDVEIAQRIAKAVRHINGGYRFKTPVPRVLETIRMEAARHGVSVAGTEIVGTLPLGAVEEIMKHYVQAHDFDLNQVIETSLLG